MKKFSKSFLVAFASLFAAFEVSGAERTADYCYQNSGADMADTSAIVTSEFLSSMKSVGVSTIARYYDYENETIRGKRLRNRELELLKQFGMKLLIVFQHKNNKVSTFQNWRTRGPSDAEQAIRMARTINQPIDSAIYFGVDGDFVGKDTKKFIFHTDAVVNYFREINRVFNSTGNSYRIGVYGSGETCRVLINQGLASYCWLSHSHGFVGSKRALSNGQYDIEQLLSGKCGGRSVDLNFFRHSNSEVGQFSVR